MLGIMTSHNSGLFFFVFVVGRFLLIVLVVVVVVVVVVVPYEEDRSSYSDRDATSHTVTTADAFRSSSLSSSSWSSVGGLGRRRRRLRPLQFPGLDLEGSNTDVVIVSSLLLASTFSSPRDTAVTPSTTKTPEHYTNKNTIRYRCRLAYDGTQFVGFQRQGSGSKKGGGFMSSTSSSSKSSSKSNMKPKRTVQDVLETVLAQRFNSRHIHIVGAGRTDKGVHARGHAFHFELYHQETKAKSTTTKSQTTTTSTPRQPNDEVSNTTATSIHDNHNTDSDDDDDNAANDDEKAMVAFEQQLEYTLNRMLPSDIRVWNLGRVPAFSSNNRKDQQWNAMRSCTSKLYSYRICIGEGMDPLERSHRWQLLPSWFSAEDADADAEGVATTLARLFSYFVGAHDFSCFAGAVEQHHHNTSSSGSNNNNNNNNNVRTIHKIDIFPEHQRVVNSGNRNRNNTNDNHDTMGGSVCSFPHYYRIDIYLDGALYKMVRTIVGSVVDVARQPHRRRHRQEDGVCLLDEALLVDLLDRSHQLNYTRTQNPAKPAPAHGLTLERVFYSDNNSNTDLF